MNLLSWLVSWLKDNGITLVALVGAAKFLLGYSRDNERKRMEMYINLREKFRENVDFDDIFKALDNYDQADDEATKTAARKKLSSILARANAYRDLGNFDLALADYAQAIRLNYSPANVLVNRGLVFADKKRRQYDFALIDFDEAIKLDPKLALAYEGRGNALLFLGRFDAAIDS